MTARPRPSVAPEFLRRGFEESSDSDAEKEPGALKSKQDCNKELSTKCKRSPLRTLPPAPQAKGGSRPVGLVAGKGGEPIVMSGEVPGVKELCVKFCIDSMLQTWLNMELRKRPNTYEEDLDALDQVLKTEPTPAAILMVKIKELQQGTFVSAIPHQRKILYLRDKFALDDRATELLSTSLTSISKETGKLALEHLETHLERSNKPSAMVMLKLNAIKNGEEIGASTNAPNPGSWLWKLREQEKDEQQEKRRRDRERDRDRNRDGSRHESRSRGRSHGRRRDNACDRSGDRGRDDESARRRDTDPDRRRGRAYDGNGRDDGRGRCERWIRNDRIICESGSGPDDGRGRDDGRDRRYDRGDDRRCDRDRDRERDDRARDACFERKGDRTALYELEFGQGREMGYAALASDRKRGRSLSRDPVFGRGPRKRGALFL